MRPSCGRGERGGNQLLHLVCYIIWDCMNKWLTPCDHLIQVERIQKAPLGLHKWFLQLLTADSGWAFNDVSYRVCYHGWLVALRGKLSDVASQGIIAFCWRKGALQNVNMLTISKSGCSYIPGKPLSSDLRHIIIDKIIEWGGDPLTMIFPSLFVNLVSVEHASVLARDPLLPSQPCFLLCEYHYLRPTLIVNLIVNQEVDNLYQMARISLLFFGNTMHGLWFNLVTVSIFACRQNYCLNKSQIFPLIVQRTLRSYPG